MADMTLAEAFWRATAGPLVTPGSTLCGWMILGGALLWDWAFGEMPRAIHPVVWMGKPIRLTKKWGLRWPQNPFFQLFLGALAGLVLPAFFALLSGMILIFAYDLGGHPLGVFMGAYLLKSSFAQRALGQAGYRVRDLLVQSAHGDPQGLDQARRSRTL